MAESKDAGVDVTSSACAPPSEPPPKQPKKPPPKTKLQALIRRPGKGVWEDCSAERLLVVRPGTCTWFLIQIKRKRLSVRDRKAVGAKLKMIVQAHCRSIPAHAEDM